MSLGAPVVDKIIQGASRSSRAARSASSLRERIRRLCASMTALRLQSFGEAASSLVVVGDDGHARFGLGVSGLTPAKVRIGFLFGQLRGGTRADVINEGRVVFGEASLHLLIAKSTVRDDFLKLCPDGFFGGFESAQEKFGVGADVFKKFPMDDEPITVFSKEQRVAVFNFGPAFSPYDNLRTCFIDAKDFLLVGNAAFSDDALVSLLDGLREEGEDVIDPTDDLPGLAGAERGFWSAMLFQQVTVGAGVAPHAPGEVFHLTQDFLAQGFTILATAGVAELNPIDRAVDVGAVAGGIIPDTEKIDGCFKAEQVERSFNYGIVMI